MSLLFVFSCKKNRLLGDKKILVGTWNWRSSTLVDYCVGWKTYAPENINTTYSVVFQKKGMIQFYENDGLLSEHKIKFKSLFIEEEGIVETNKKISFTILLDGDTSKILYGSGTPHEFQFNDFPFGSDDECVVHSFNHFRRE